MKILGADLSLAGTGWASAVDGKIHRNGSFGCPGEGISRLCAIRDKFMGIVNQSEPELVVFEDFSFASKGSAVHEIAGMTYMIRAELYKWGLPFFACAPSTLKKFVVGSAGSGKNPVRKEHMLKEIFRRFGHDVSDNNIADALGLAYLGMAFKGEWDVQIQAQADVISTLKKKFPKI